MQFVLALLLTVVLVAFAFTRVARAEGGDPVPAGTSAGASAEEAKPAAPVSWFGRWWAGEPPAEEPTGILTRAQLRTKLTALAASKPPAPDTLDRGAMCYKQSRITGTVDVVCSSCGKKTVHKKNATTKRIEACERLVQAIRTNEAALDATLDTTGFCDTCSASLKFGRGGLGLLINYPGEKEPQWASINETRLKALLALLQGKDRIKSSSDRESPLKSELKSLARILGIEVGGE